MCVIVLMSCRMKTDIFKTSNYNEYRINLHLTPSKYFLTINICSSEIVSPCATFNNLIIFTVKFSPEQCLCYQLFGIEQNNIS